MCSWSVSNQATGGGASTQEKTATEAPAPLIEVGIDVRVDRRLAAALVDHARRRIASFCTPVVTDSRRNVKGSPKIVSDMPELSGDVKRRGDELGLAVRPVELESRCGPPPSSRRRSRR
jgi:hypothetical protein